MSERPRALGAEVPERLAALTRLRGLLIGWVVVYHLELALHGLGRVPVLGNVVMKGYLGVDGFFLLSGFALFLGYHRRPPLGTEGWRGFVRRRAARIFPLHLAALALLLAIVVAAAAAGVSIRNPERFGAWEFVMQAMLANAWETTRIHAWNYPSWALSATWAGYLLFPAILPLVLWRRPAGAWAIAAACVVLLTWLGAEEAVQLNLTLHLGLLRFGLEFVLGMALARLVTLREMPGLAAAAAALLLPLGLALRLDAMAVAGLAGIIALLGKLPPASAPPRDLLWRLGEASFGVYLCWVFVEGGLVLLQRAADPGPVLRVALMLGGLVATLALGWLAWRLVEVPAARRLARLMP
ncbi:acyltransferase family protein [Falsiroseomonas sp. HW251]|uniref:acyltransferase family protein n=1 Tax=Falsiroseomonas sp. HW251 TaxID=3390998 RepID=UPI003D3138B7